MLRLLRTSGFDVVNLIELQAPAETGQDEPLIPYITDEWARQWPAEEIWCAERRAD
jgi:hypothetical protein